METTLMNGNTVISIRENGDIHGEDIRDQNNLPSCFNRTKRSVKKAWAALTAAWTDETTMYQACTILSANGVRMHSYCAMD